MVQQPADLSLFHRVEVRHLISLVERAPAPNRHLDRLVHYLVGTSVRQPPYRLELSIRDQWDVKRYTDNFDAARSLTNWVLVGASDIGADGLAWVSFANPATTPSGQVEGISFGGGHGSLARAACAAAIRAYLIDKGVSDVR